MNVSDDVGWGVDVKRSKRLCYLVGARHSNGGCCEQSSQSATGGRIIGDEEDGEVVLDRNTFRRIRGGEFTPL